MGVLFAVKALLLNLEVIYRLLNEPLALPLPSQSDSGCTIYYSETLAKSEVLELFLLKNYLSFKWIIYTTSLAERNQTALPKEKCVINIIHQNFTNGELIWKQISSFLYDSFYNKRMPPYSIVVTIFSDQETYSRACGSYFIPHVAYLLPFRAFYFRPFCGFRRYRKNFGRVLLMDKYYTPIVVDQVRILVRLEEGGFKHVWNVGSHRALKKLDDHKLKYTDNRGFKDDNPSVVLITNLVPLFTVWGCILGFICFPMFMAEVWLKVKLNLNAIIGILRLFPHLL